MGRRAGRRRPTRREKIAMSKEMKAESKKQKERDRVGVPCPDRKEG